ncbi:hypothetical protein HIM_03268 [Hirsutella minnesotensis 3608]|nr:hypothetical protein HIM_03268 [Hirsutella minnesotensis 3608]
MASSVATPAVPAIHVLTSLPARPPTPPREASHDVDVSLRSVLGKSQSFDPLESLQTPPNVHSPVSAVTGSNPSSNRVRKRVEWSSHTDYKDPPDYLEARSHPLSTPSSASSKPVKGILKPSPSPSSLASSLGTHLDGTIAQPNLIEMLESTIKQLAGSDRDLRLDAYMMLARALKASNNLPDRVALQNKMGLFMQFIQRDVTSRTSTGALDSSLVNHALNLLAIFLHFQAIASTITSDFGVFLIDHAIRSFEDPAMPKDVVRHLMQVVAFQNFSPKVMTPDRVGRLLVALHRIEEHLQGKSIIMSRLHIYKRLVRQARNSMIAQSDWLKDMLTDMLSSVKDIRAQAISLGTEAGFALRTDKQFLRRAADILRASNGDETYISHYIGRLKQMLNEKQVAHTVPQIWSVVILLLRCPLERWEYYNPWFTLVQACFNKSDVATKREVNYAWNRYICLSIIDGQASPAILKSLCDPLKTQLKRKINPRVQEEAFKLRRIVLGSVCSIYYHAIAQGDQKFSADLIWDGAIEPIVTQLIDIEGSPEAPNDGLMQAARILAGLLDISTPRPSRNPDRIMDNTPLIPEELLPIDCKWVRRNCDKVFKVVEPILQRKLADLANRDSLVYRLWQALVGSVAAASAKDIKVSEDTTKFIACSLTLLNSVWSKGLDGLEASAHVKFLPSVQNLVQLLADRLGVLPFMEKKICLDTPGKSEVTKGTLPISGRVPGSQGTLRTPLQHVFLTLSCIPPGCADNEELANTFQSVFEPFFKSRNSQSRSVLARELIHLLPRNALSPYGPWLLAAENMQLSIDKPFVAPGSGVAGNDRLLGPQYRELVSILERGLTSHPSLPAAQWSTIFDRVSADVSGEFGDAGRALVVVEPLAKAIYEHSMSNRALPPASSLRTLEMLLNSAVLPRDRKALEIARFRLWGAPPVAAKASGSDPFDNLYKLINDTMKILYDNFPALETQPETAAFVKSVCSFIERCISQGVIRLLSKMQPGLGPWVQDEERQLKQADKTSILEAVRQTWQCVCKELAALERLERKNLDPIEPLLLNAFKSKHDFIVNRTAETWNALMVDKKALECSDSFRSVILSLQTKLNLSIPGTESSNTNWDAQPSPADGLLESSSLVVLSSATPNHESTVVAATAASSSVSKRSPDKKRKLASTPEVSDRLPKRTSKSRLRHENSQLQFTVIAPSSSPKDESQHLTARQKEVRARQQNNTPSYSELQTDSQDLPEHGVSDIQGIPEEPLPGIAATRDTTPKRDTSFDDMVRSTPTPRRGQMLPIDDVNDPPSSPPVPRPYPLLSEIQSRSRISTSLENWEFSSPAGSPVAKTQQTFTDSAPVSPVVRSRSSPPRTRTRTRRQKRAAMREQEARVIPSSITDDDKSMAGSQVPDLTTLSAVDATPTTPSRQPRVSSRNKRQPAPRHHKNVFVDARSSPELTPSSIHESHDVIEAPANNERDSIADDNGTKGRAATDLVIELESRRHEISASEGGDSPSKNSIAERQPEECILALPDTPRGPTTRRESRRLASLAMPSTPSEIVNLKLEGGSRRKRKRGGARQSEGRSKRKRSAEPEVTDQPDETPVAASPAPLVRRDASPSGGLEMRRSSRKRKSRVSNSWEAEAVASPDNGEKVEARRGAAVEAGDTDEEVTSQLVNESFAASQQSEETQEAPKRVTRRATKQGSQKLDDASNVTVASPARGQPRGGPSTETEAESTILDTLRSGLEQLQTAALTRDEMYELEDVLIDIKRELYEAERRGREGKTGK